MAPESQLLDPRTLVRIRDLALRSRAVIDGMCRGVHHTPQPGLSVEFTEYRSYAMGDDLRFLDWKRYARSDRLYVRRFEDETNLRCWFLFDVSRSMAFGEQSVSKIEYGATLIATLSYVLINRRDAVGLARFAERIESFHPARLHFQHWRRLLGALSGSSSATTTDLGRSVEQIGGLLKGRGLVIVVSDFLAELESMRLPLARLRARGHDVLLLQLLDPAEVHFVDDGRHWIRDLETGRRITVDPNRTSAEYHERFARHQETLRELARATECDVETILTSTPLDQALSDLLERRARLTKGRVLRRSQGGSVR
ncbi:MAG: DUF58 domain-containing protein [Pirellulaceae bacterium]|nr:DUF58 domain-containing protein [Planctomycetales bacterium]